MASCACTQQPVFCLPAINLPSDVHAHCACTIPSRCSVCLQSISPAMYTHTVHAPYPAGVLSACNQSPQPCTRTLCMHHTQPVFCLPAINLPSDVHAHCACAMHTQLAFCLVYSHAVRTTPAVLSASFSLHSSGLEMSVLPCPVRTTSFHFWLMSGVLKRNVSKTGRPSSSISLNLWTVNNKHVTEPVDSEQQAWHSTCGK